ncbi:MAG: hypothetical protein A3B68_00330 [Candidatus Melainabacteria bacterium RIFCSPHIGHO2_02_FULL_34_12]|nr:MAG: hypothetical protein A3B68_00330 [Candidatus Melainabacteria bacterium RIFCSPHIGHO2_02_FULL_34_12]
MKSQKKNKLSEIVNNVKLLKPKQKLVVLKALQDEKPLTEKDIKIMEWTLDAIKGEQRNNRLLKEGLRILDKAVERQTKKS